MSNRANILKNIGLNSFVTFFNTAFPLLLIPIITSRLSPEDIGYIFFLDTTAKYLSIFALIGIPIYGVRELSKAKTLSTKANIFSELSLLSLGVSSTIILLIIAHALIMGVWSLYTVLLIFLFLSYTFSFEWTMQGLEKFKQIAIRNFVLRLAMLLSALFFVKEQDDAITYFYILVIINLLIGIANLFVVLKGGIKINNNNIKASFNKHKKPLSIIFLTSFSISIYTLFDTIFLKWFSTNSAVAFYTVGLKASAATSAIIGAISMAIIPRLSSVLVDDVNAYNNLLRMSFRLTFLVALPASILLNIHAETIINLISNENYEKSVIVLEVLSFLPLIIGLSSIFGIQVLTIKNREKQLLKAVILGGIISLVLNYFLVPGYAELGAAISYLATETLVTTLTACFALKHIELSFDKSAILIMACKGLILLTVGLYIKKHFSGNRQIMMTFLFVITYLSLFIKDIKKILKYQRYEI